MVSETTGQNIRARHPLLVVCTVWLVAYIPLVVGLGLFAPERTFTARLDHSHIFSVTENCTVYQTDRVHLSICHRGECHQVFVVVPDDYVPETLILQGYGKLYTNDPYDVNRSWTLPPAAASHLQDINATEWWVRVSGRTDVMRYRDRGTTLLEGRLLYRDVRTETPPLINVLWVVPVLAGGSMAAFRAYFAIFALAAACVVATTHLSRDNNLGVSAALFLLFNPLTLYTVLIEVEDEIVITLLFAVIIRFLHQKKRLRAAGGIGMGMAFKMWPILFLPGLLSGPDRWVRKIRSVLLAGGVAGVSMLLFLLPAQGDCMVFVRLYLTGEGSGSLQGISIWKYLGELGLETQIMLPLLAVGSGMLFLKALHKRMEAVHVSLLFLLLFLFLYPKIHVGYHLYILPFLPFVWKHCGIRWATLGIGGGVIALSLSRHAAWSADALLLASLAAAGLVTVLVGYVFAETWKEAGRHPEKGQMG